jgi:ectoine hydroxylase-related dioxygenase (phytanoyl-CoA dioxygenase family)
MEEVNDLFHGEDVMQKDLVIRNSNSQLSTLKWGDCILFNALTLHCRNANESTGMRWLFNFSFCKS